MKKATKYLYNIIPFKFEFYSFLKIFWKPREYIYKHLHFKGIIKVKVEDSSFRMKHHGYQIENEIFWVGLTNGWEKESIKLWIKLSKKANVIFDIGANTGIYSLIAKAVHPNSKVFAFEPVKRVFDKLQENIQLNKFDIYAQEEAISNSTGTAVIYDTYSDHIYSVTVNKNLASSTTKVVEKKISTITLNDFIKKHNIEKIDLIKIDVETHEPEVLEGFSDYLSIHKPTILIEILNDEIGNKVSALIQGLGYLYFNIDEKGSPRKVDNITKSDYFNYLLCSQDTASEIGLIK
ncbi:MAG: FkbM family methyltransferase [Bacteroidia bacterium]|nr:FkbM family methyltransferase [Bacteroidia bacterium]